MYEEGINLKIKLAVSVFYMFYRKSSPYRTFFFGKINLAIGNKKIDNRYFNLCRVNFCWDGGDVKRRGRKIKNAGLTLCVNNHIVE